jgi:hypothetical protein
MLAMLAACHSGSSAADQAGIAFDRGGVSVDFLAANKGWRQTDAAERRVLFHEDFETPDAKTGLPPKWNSGVNVQTSYTQDYGKLLELVRPLMEQKVLSEGGNRFVSLNADGKIRALLDTHAKDAYPKPLVCGNISRSIALPEPYHTRKVRVRFKYRGVLAEGIERADAVWSNNALFVQAYTTDDASQGGQRVDFKQKVFSRFNGHWHEGEFTALCTEKAKSLTLLLIVYGYVNLGVDEITVEEVGLEDKGISVCLFPQSLTDNLYCMAAGEPSILNLALQNEAGAEVKAPVIVLELPEGIEVNDARIPIMLQDKKPLLRDGRKYTQYRYAIDYLKNAIVRDRLTDYNTCYFFFQSSLEPGETLYPARYWVEDGDYASAPKSFQFKIISSISSVRPKAFETGIVVARELDFKSRDSMRSFVDFYANKGFNTIHTGGAPSELMRMFRDKGIKRYVQPYYLCNGYRLGEPPKPDNVRYQLQDGSYHNEGTCPVAIYQPGEWYRNSIVPMLRKLIVEDRVTDSIMPNWEPYMFNSNGCFCPRCKAEFIRFAKLPAAEVDKDWPNSIVAKHQDIWVKFRSWQHGQLVKQLERTVVEVGKEAGIDAHFVPEIAIAALTEDERSQADQYDPLDYIKALKLVEPWGPYVYHDAPGPFAYYTGMHVMMDVMTREVNEYIARHIPDPENRPGLIGFPAGLMEASFVADPDGLAFDTLSLFVNGWQGSLAYYFPQGFDARYWNALSSANQAISRFEDLVTNGRPQSRFRLEMLSQLPELNPESYAARKLKKRGSLIFCHEFMKDDKRLFAIGNAWEYGDAFVQLALEDAVPGKKYVLREPLTSRYYANKEGDIALSASDLSAGLVLHVGGLRFAFFLVEPYQPGMDYGQAVTPGAMRATMDAYLPDIRRALEFEQTYQSEL